MRSMRVLAVLLAVVVMSAGGALAATAPVGAGAEITSDQLVYQGASIETQVDVNGEAAVQLIGGILDAAATQVQAQAKAMEGKGGEGPMAMLPLAAPMIEPAKEAIKSLSRVALVVMKPKEPVKGDQFLKYYQSLLSPGGWLPLVTVRDKEDTVLALLAPEAKGVFFAVNEGNEMTVGMVTTTKPLGDLLGQIVTAGGGALPAFLSMRQAQAKPAPAKPAPAKPAAKKKPASRRK